MICAFCVLCYFEEKPPPLSLFRAFFKLRRQGVGAWWAFTARPGRAFPLGLPSKVRGWRDRFLYAHVEGIRSVWREPDTSSNEDSSVRERDEELFDRLRHGQVPNFRELLSEANLVEAELAPVAAMRITAEELEAAARRKDQAAGSKAKHPRRIRRGGPTRPIEAPAVPTPAGGSAERETAVSEATAPAAAEPERREEAATEQVVAVPDEVESPVAADVPDAGQVADVAGPPAAVGPRAEGAPPDAGEGEQGARAGESVGRKRKSRPGDSSHPAAPSLSWPRARRAQGELIRLAPAIEDMNNAALATSLVAPIHTTEFQQRMEGLNASDYLDMAMTAIVQVANGTIGLRKELHRTSGKLGAALARIGELRTENQAYAESNAKLREELAALEAGSRGRLRELEGQAAAAEARAEMESSRARLAADESRELTRQLERARGEGEAARCEARVAIEAARCEARAAMERAANVEKEVVNVRAEKEGAAAYADEANARAEEARARAEEAEGTVRRLEAEAGRLVSDYKASADFRQEVVEGSLDAYIKGFELCKVRVSEFLRIDAAQLDGVTPGGADEEPAGDQSDEEETGPSDL